MLSRMHDMLMPMTYILDVLRKLFSFCRVDVPDRKEVSDNFRRSMPVYSLLIGLCASFCRRTNTG